MANDLYIRWRVDLDDRGARPVPGTDNYWSSPSLSIVKLNTQSSPWSKDPTHDPSTAEVGATNQYIEVLVHNKSQTKRLVHVQAWVRGFGTTGPWIAGGSGGLFANRSPEDGSLLEAPALGTARAWLPWHPTAADLDGNAEAHACLFANCYVPGAADPDGAALTSGDQLDPVGNQHNAQRNITLKKVTTVAPALAFELYIGNTLRKPIEEEFEIAITRRRAQLVERLDLARLGLDRQLMVPTGIDLPLSKVARLDKGDRPGKRPPKLPPGKEQPDFDIELDGKRSRKHRVGLAPGKFRKVKLGVGFDKRPKPGMHAFDVTQSVRGRLVGAATIVLAVEQDGNRD